MGEPTPQPPKGPSDTAIPPGTELMHYVPGKGLMPRSELGLWRHAQFVSKSGLAPYNLDSPEKVYVAMAYGMEIGFSPMMSLTTVCVINGFPSMYGDGPLALVEAAGLLEAFEEGFSNDPPLAGVPLKDWPDELTAWCRIKRKGRQLREFTYSVGDARRAGLWMKRGRNGGDTPWVTSPTRMLRFRCRGFALRDTCPDALKGFRQAEEVADYDIVDTQPGRPVFDPAKTEAAKTSSGDALAKKIAEAAAAAQPPSGAPPVQSPPKEPDAPAPPQPAPAKAEPEKAPPAATRTRRRIKDDQPTLGGIDATPPRRAYP